MTGTFIKFFLEDWRRTSCTVGQDKQNQTSDCGTHRSSAGIITCHIWQLKYPLEYVNTINAKRLSDIDVCLLYWKSMCKWHVLETKYSLYFLIINLAQQAHLTFFLKTGNIKLALTWFIPQLKHSLILGRIVPNSQQSGKRFPYPVPKFCSILVLVPGEQSIPESRQDILRFPESCIVIWANPGSQKYPSRPWSGCWVCIVSYKFVF